MQAPFIQWIPKDVEERVIEAAETLMLSPNVLGPGRYGSSMPEHVRSLDESYNYNHARYRRQPQPDAIDRMEKTWEWINALPEHDRKLIYSWSYFKVRKGFKVTELIASMDYPRSVFYRELQRIFADIAENLNKSYTVQLTLGQNDPILPPNHIKSPQSVQRDGNAWMAPGAKPRVDPELPKKRTIKTAG